MQKISTSLNKTDYKTNEKSADNSGEMQPSDKSIRKILQFAANYRVQKTENNQYIEMFLS